MLDDAGDVGQAGVRQIGVFVAGKHRLAALPDRLVAMHARAVIAIDRLRHERCGLAVDLRDLLDAVLVDDQPIGHHRERREFQAEFVLRGSHFVMVLLDDAAHARHGSKHFRAHVLRRILRRHREVAFFGADAMAEIAAFVVGVRIGRQFDRVELKAGVVRVYLVFHVVEHEELGFGSEEDRVADAHRLDHGLGLLGDAARIAVIGLAGGRLENVANQRHRGFSKKWIDAGSRRIRHQAHVGFVDRLPAGDRGAVEHHGLRQRCPLRSC